MRFTAVLLLAICATWLASATMNRQEAEYRALFEKWSAEHNKEYSNEAELNRRFKIFSQNLDLITSHNLEMNSYKMDLNVYADLTADEFRAAKLMPRRAAPKFASEKYAAKLSAESLPASFDWRAQNPSPVTSVKDQGSVGTCWTFSTVGNVEGVWSLAGHPLVDLSPEQLVDCDAEADPANTNADCGVFGGWPYLAFQYIIKAGGLKSLAEYPYCCGTGDCYPCMAKGTSSNCGPGPYYCNATQNQCAITNPAAKISSWVAISTDEDQIAAQLMARGPLSVALDATNLQFYSSGVWAPSGCSKTDLDHAVLIVGFTTTSPSYWIVKNSWGPKWGQSGYFFIARGQGMCGINTQVTSAVV